MRQSVTFAFLLFVMRMLAAQPVSVHPDSMMLPPARKPSEILTAGKWQLDTREYFMATQYARRSLKSDHTLAAGIGAAFVSAPWRGLGFGVSAFAHTEVFGTDLTAVDSLTGLQNRYEIGLYDIYNLKTTGLYRTEELYIYYHDTNVKLRAGQMLLNTPLVNGQDGRMRAGLVRGLHGDWLISRKLRFQGAWLSAFSPRGTTNWFNTGKSIGVYSVGVNINGVRSGYAGHLSSSGLFLASLEYRRKRLDVQVWNYTVPGIFNTVLLKNEWQVAGLWHIGAMAIRQDRLKNGGSEMAGNRYFEMPFSWSGSARVEYRSPDQRIRVNLNYTRITSHGRYLFPREWGRDAFYTFLSRERNEGFGNLHAATLGVQGKMKMPGLHWMLAGGYFHTPDYRALPNLNKYAQNAYWQVNATLRMNSIKKVPGLDVFLLLLTKLQAENEDLPLRLEYNRLNYYHLNLVITYKLTNY